MRCFILAVGLLGMAGLLLVSSARAQEPPPPDSDEEPARTIPSTPPDNTDSENAGSGATGSRKDEMERVLERLDTLEGEVEAGKAKNAALKEEMADLRDEMELVAANKETVDTTHLLTVFGFFDLTYFKGFYDNDSLYNLYTPTAGTFTISNANLYFKSEMTESLNAIMELKFSFLPSGQEVQYEDESILADGSVISTGAEYVRIDTTVRDPVTTVEFRQGGVTLERLHVTYSPFDWLNILAGRYLTPYGIWNVEHGAPVVLPARIPNLQYRQIMPLAQTGFQIFGRLFPSDTLLLDYALTLSNGRGPTDEFLDLDENKGVGLRLKLTYSGKHITAVAGSYGYFGEFTDIKKRAVVRLNENFVPDTSRDDAMTTKLITTEAYKEAVVSYDLTVSFLGVKIQSEAIWKRVFYTTHPLIPPNEAVVNGLSPMVESYISDYIGWGAYVLGSYTIPLPLEWLHITPYVMYEKGDALPYSDVTKISLLYAGLNIKPSPYVTLKIEYNRAWIASKLMNDVNILALQLAVSF